ncbi:P-protein [Candidatus Annandia adelgestsuga]|uniref:Bifunctional chorismate mutase/prephenate dehydratase n=1 Tax=Candidatus Annandia adelgestsuga TaxID=1302411 RepID=A0A3Q9CL82_9ENTR|nr:prephenate dehydratase domain-containing protein [Candidatus Annandia adelgestsuga]AZP36155.1 P-protein [Candidatus Annandia adelgestsuga]
MFFLKILYKKFKYYFIYFFYILYFYFKKYKKNYKKKNIVNKFKKKYNKSKILNFFLLGPKGSYSNIAYIKYIKNKYKNNVLKLCYNFKEIIIKTENINKSFALLPIENTNSGSIYEIYDLLINSKLYILKEFNMKINHCLLSSKKNNINKIIFLYSHSQPFQQCSNFIKKFSKLNLINTNSTSTAMKIISKINSFSVAAIGSKNGAKLYNLFILRKNINNYNNITKFILLSNKNLITKNFDYKFIILIINFNKNNNKIINIIILFNKNNIIINKLEYRIFKNFKSQEVLYINFKNNFNFIKFKKILDKIKKKSNYIKFIGYYKINKKNFKLL